MYEFLQSDMARIVIGFASIAMLVVIGVYIVAKVRAEMIDSKPQTSELLTNFYQLREQGELTDAEYRTIKGKLADKLQGELNDSGGTG